MGYSYGQRGGDYIFILDCIALAQWCPICKILYSRYLVWVSNDAICSNDVSLYGSSMDHLSRWQYDSNYVDIIRQMDD